MITARASRCSAIAAPRPAWSWRMPTCSPRPGNSLSPAAGAAVSPGSQPGRRRTRTREALRYRRGECDVGKLHDQVADVLAADLAGRTAWDEAPGLYFLYKRGGGGGHPPAGSSVRDLGDGAALACAGGDGGACRDILGAPHPPGTGGLLRCRLPK